jgi:hypothetical protein
MDGQHIPEKTDGVISGVASDNNAHYLEIKNYKSVCLPDKVFTPELG